MESEPDRDSRAIEVERELKRLRQRAGLSAQKITDCPRLRDLAAAVASREPGYGGTAPGPLGVKLIQDGLEAIQVEHWTDSLNVEALRAAYGLDPRYQGREVGDRRIAFGHGHGNRLPDAVTDWEDAAIAALAVWLIWRASGGAVSTPAEPTAGFKEGALPQSASRSQFHIVRHDFTIALSDKRVPTEILVVREAEALVDGATDCEVRMQYYDDPQPDTLTLVPLINCRIKATDYTTHRWQAVTLELPRAKKGERVYFSYRLALTKQVPMRPIVQIIGQGDGGIGTVRLSFSSGACPTSIWGFTDVSEMETPNSPDAPNALPVHINELLCATFSAEELKHGLYHGVTWRWGDESSHAGQASIRTTGESTGS